MSVEWEYQKAIYSALNGDATLMAEVAAIYDRAPQAADGSSLAVFPYVTIGQVITTMNDTFSENAFSCLARLHTWSRTGSYKQTKEIQGLMFDVLHNQSLTVTGHNCYQILRESSQVFLEEDGEIHGVCEYRALIEET